MSRVYAWVAVSGAALAVAVVALMFVFRSQPKEIDPDDPVQVALGGQIYAERCARCHGANLEGQPNWMARKPDGRLPAPPHDASGHTWHHPDRDLFGIVKHGLTPYAPPGYQSDMPVFAGTLS